MLSTTVSSHHIRRPGARTLHTLTPAQHLSLERPPPISDTRLAYRGPPRRTPPTLPSARSRPSACTSCPRTRAARRSVRGKGGQRVPACVLAMGSSPWRNAAPATSAAGVGTHALLQVATLLTQRCPRALQVVIKRDGAPLMEVFALKVGGAGRAAAEHRNVTPVFPPPLRFNRCNIGLRPRGSCAPAPASVEWQLGEGAMQRGGRCLASAPQSRSNAFPLVSSPSLLLPDARRSQRRSMTWSWSC